MLSKKEEKKNKNRQGFLNTMLEMCAHTHTVQTDRSEGQGGLTEIF